MKRKKTHQWYNRQNLSIFILWIILTSLNLTKAYHIDDAFHLEAAAHIKTHLLSPMSGYINWANIPTPLYKHNQPPLFFYIISLTQSIFGESELVMHLLLSLFTLLSLIYFYKLMIVLAVKQRTTLLLLFAFCPAFIVNQNLMTDVPILAITLSSMYYLLAGLKYDTLNSILISVILLSLGLLIRYSLLPLFLVLLITILFHPKKKGFSFTNPNYNLSTLVHLEFDSI